MGARYLIVKTSALGDIVQALPVASFLKSIDPTCIIDWVVEAPGAELLRACPMIDRVLTINTKRWRKNWRDLTVWKEIRECREQLRQYRYEAIFDLQGNTKSGFITGAARGKCKGGYGFSTLPEWPNFIFTNVRVNPPKGLNISEEYLWIVSKLLSQSVPEVLPPVTMTVSQSERDQVNRILLQAHDPVLLAPGSAWENKKLSKTQLMDLMKRWPEERTLYLVGGNEEELTLCRELSQTRVNCVVVPKLSLPMLHLLMSRMTLVVSMDSLPLHLAGTTGVPTLSFFGPSLGLKYAPKGTQHEYVQGGCPYGQKFEKRCPLLRSCSTGACIKELKL